ncbi:MAG: hypothetical protein EB824_06470 [Thaumarchaeota archaeon S15]|nr:MAG: hypothetical protein EB824_06470 [Thaumarchaeota archaeon S15]
MDDDLKRRIWDVIYEKYSMVPLKAVWVYWVKNSVEGMEDDYADGKIATKYWFRSGYNDVYDLLEIISQNMEPKHRPEFEEAMNSVLAENMSGWRLDDGLVVGVMTREEKEAIRKAATLSEENARYGGWPCGRWAWAAPTTGRQ